MQGQKGEEAGADAKALASHDLTCKQCITSRELDYLCNEIRLLEIKLSEAELQLATPTDDGGVALSLLLPLRRRNSNHGGSWLD